MHPFSLADDLAETRAEIARLKLREARLRAQILAAKRPVSAGRWSRVEIRESRALVFDARLLPPEIREDPRYLRERVTQSILCLPVQQVQILPRPGWPIRRRSALAQAS